MNLASSDSAWERVASLNVPRTHMSVGNVGNQLIVAGGNEYKFSEKGYSHKTIRDKLELLNVNDPEAGWQTGNPIPTGPRGWAATVNNSDSLYLFGGVTWKETGADRYREAWCYFPRQDQWEAKASAPVAISGWEGALYRDRYALLAGGVAQRDEPGKAPQMIWSDLCWAFDCEENQWLRIDGQLPPGAVFNDPGVVIIGNTIYVTGAEGPFGSHYNYLLVGELKPARP
ncbi:MAG: hypothetical protein R3C11_10250 [Planctomycetaceae bacterium]